MPPGHGLRPRPVRDRDAGALIALVGAVYAEYEGCVLDLAGVDADLVAPRASIEAKRGDLWVVEDSHDHVVATCGWAPSEVTGDTAVELKRLYVRADRRGSGLGTWLVGQVEQVARERGASVVELWSDSRFVDAHRLYERLGYAATGTVRELNDPSETTEYHFLKRLGPGAV